MATPTLSDAEDEQEETEEVEETTEVEESVEEPEDASELFDDIEGSETSDDENDASDGEPETPEEVEEQLVNLDEDTVSMFDDVEASSEEDSDSETESVDEEPVNPFGEGDDLTAGIAGIVVETASEAACLGLDETTTEELQPQYESLFETMRLGYFSQRVFEEQIMSGQNKDINPAWGLLASALICGCVALWMRPDRDEQIQTIKAVFNGEQE